MAAKSKSRKKPSKGNVAQSVIKAGKAIDFALKIDPAKERDKPRLVALLFFDYSNVTQERKLNLMGVFDRIFVDHAIKRVPVSIFVRAYKTWDFPLVVTIIAPDNTRVGGLAFSPEGVKLSDRTDQLQTIGRVEFPAKMEGAYWFDVSYGEQSLGGAPLLVEFRNLKELADGHTRGDA